MFCVVPCADVDVLKKICAETGAQYNPDCILNMILIVGDRVAGVSQTSLSGKTARLVYAGVIPELRGKGYGDLVIRSAINKVMDLVDVVEIGSHHEYFKRFGFEKAEFGWSAKSKDIVFPSYCGGCK